MLSNRVVHNSEFEEWAFFLLYCMSIHPSTPSIYLSSIYPSICEMICQFILLSMHLSISVCLSIYLSIYQPFIHIFIYLSSIYPSICKMIRLFILLSMHLSISVCLSVCLSIYLSIRPMNLKLFIKCIMCGIQHIVFVVEKVHHLVWYL